MENKTSKICPVCSLEFKVKPSHFERRTYCSKECMSGGYKERMSGENNPNYKESNNKNCSFCGVIYHSHNKKRIYCTKSCAMKVNSKKLRKPRKSGLKKPYKLPLKTANCKNCNAVIFRKHRYCADCRKQRSLPKIYTFQCKQCGKDFSKRNIKTGVYCSFTCRNKNISERQKGENSHLWQGGKTDKNKLIRNSGDYDNWRKSVFCRDNHTCNMCFQIGGKLAAHHILVFSKFPEFALDVWNGITLCRDCHISIRHKENRYVFDFLKITFQNLENTFLAQILSELPKPTRLALAKFYEQQFDQVKVFRSTL